jgi:hypothetical protein
MQFTFQVDAEGTAHDVKGFVHPVVPVKRSPRPGRFRPFKGCPPTSGHSLVGKDANFALSQIQRFRTGLKHKWRGDRRLLTAYASTKTKQSPQ